MKNMHMLIVLVISLMSMIRDVIVICMIRIRYALVMQVSLHLLFNFFGGTLKERKINKNKNRKAFPY